MGPLAGGLLFRSQVIAGSAPESGASPVRSYKHAITQSIQSAITALERPAWVLGQSPLLGWLYLLRARMSRGTCLAPWRSQTIPPLPGMFQHHQAVATLRSMRSTKRDGPSFVWSEEALMCWRWNAQTDIKASIMSCRGVIPIGGPDDLKVKVVAPSCQRWVQEIIINHQPQHGRMRPHNICKRS